MKRIVKKKYKRKKLKESFKRFLIYTIAILAIIIYGSVESYKIYKLYKYEASYEYKLQQIGYSLDQTKTLENKLTDSELNQVLNLEYDEQIYNIVNEKYFLNTKFYEYIEYLTMHPTETSKNIVAITNVNANKGWYSSIYKTDIDFGYGMLVNKFYGLEKDYIRTDMENISLTYSYNGNKAAQIVVENYYKMHEDINKELGVYLMVNSSYRSYEDQETVYETYKKKNLKKADSIAARPGHSEHQTGLAIDLTSLEHPYEKDFKESEEYEWLKENCHKYGFILRYPIGKENITGYQNESWHFRYVGKEIAKIIYENNITLDEYHAYYILNK